MDMDFIKRLTSESDLTEITAALEAKMSPIIKAQTRVLAEDEDPNPQPQEGEKQYGDPKLDFDIDYVNMLRLENAQLSLLLNLYQKRVDAILPHLKSDIDNSIQDYNSAYQATVFYSKDWFANSLLSNDAKVEIASYLKSTIERYCGTNLDTLEMIERGDPGMMTYIIKPRNI